MKKVIYLIVSILALPLVSAEDIIIGGKAYPLIIILPLVLILLVWAILLVSYLKSNFHKISLMIYNLRRYLRRIGLGKVSDALKEIKLPKKPAEDKKIFENIREYLWFLKNENRKKHIEHLLHEERAALKSNMKSTYNRILNMYIQLTPQEKAKVYPQLMDFYNDVNKAIFSSVYGEESKKHLISMQKELLRISKLPKKMPLAERIRKTIDELFPKKVAVAQPPQAPIRAAKKSSDNQGSIFAAIKSFFNIEAKARHKHIMAEDIQAMHKPPKTISDLKTEEEKSIDSIKRLIQEDKEARKKRGEISHELNERRKDRASLKKSNIPLPQLRKREPLAALKKQPEQKRGFFSELFTKKQEESRPVFVEEKQAIKAAPTPIEALTDKREEEEKELLRKIDDMVKESAQENRRKNELRERIASAQQLLKQNNLNGAKKSYEKLKPLFYSLPNENQKAVYPLLTTLQRQIAELELRIKEGAEHGLEKEERIILEKMSKLRSR